MLYILYYAKLSVVVYDIIRFICSRVTECGWYVIGMRLLFDTLYTTAKRAQRCQPGVFWWRKYSLKQLFRDYS